MSKPEVWKKKKVKLEIWKLVTGGLKLSKYNEAQKAMTDLNFTKLLKLD